MNLPNFDGKRRFCYEKCLDDEAPPESNQHGGTVRPHSKRILRSVLELALGDPTKNREIRPLPAIGQQLRICKLNAQNLHGAIAAALKACAQAQFCIGHTNGCSDKKLNQREHLLLH